MFRAEYYDEKMVFGKVTLPKFNRDRKRFVSGTKRLNAYAAMAGFTQSIQRERDPQYP